jgi:hypothetical protein
MVSLPVSGLGLRRPFQPLAQVEQVVLEHVADYSEAAGCILQRNAGLLNEDLQERFESRSTPHLI